MHAATEAAEASPTSLTTFDFEAVLRSDFRGSHESLHASFEIRRARGARYEPLLSFFSRSPRTPHDLFSTDDESWATPLAWAERRGHVEIARCSGLRFLERQLAGRLHLPWLDDACAKEPVEVGKAGVYSGLMLFSSLNVLNISNAAAISVRPR